MVETDAGCDKRLEKRVVRDFYKPLTRCIDGLEAAPVSVQAAATSLGYNVGVAAVCRSTAARMIEGRRYSDACTAMTAFNRAGGRVVGGLVARREMGDTRRIGEAELCVSGLQ